MSTADTKLKAAILIISDTAHANPPSDKSSQVLDDTFRDDGGGQWHVASRKIVPDEVHAIRNQIQAWCDEDESMNLVLTSGGTGFAVKDITPEAVRPLIQKDAPGLV